MNEKEIKIEMSRSDIDKLTNQIKLEVEKKFQDQIKTMSDEINKSTKAMNDFMNDIAEIGKVVRNEKAHSISYDEFVKEKDTKFKNKEQSCDFEIRRDDNIIMMDAKTHKIMHDFENKEYELKCNLKEILDQMGRKQSWLSEKSSVKYGTLRDLIMKPSSANVFNVIKVCKTLDISIDELFDIVEITE